MKAETKAQSNASQQSGKQNPDNGDNALLQALKRLDSLLGRAVAQAEATYGKDAGTDPFRGLHINKQQIDTLLSVEPGAPLLWQPREAADVEDEDYGVRLNWLKHAFALSPFEMDVILIALAPELDLRYEPLYAYLQDHVAKKRPTVNLALNLLCPSPEAKLEHRRYFTADAPLIRHKLLHRIPDPNQTQSPPPPSLLTHSLKLDEQIEHMLLGQQGLDSRLIPYCELRAPSVDLDALETGNALKRGLRTLVVEARKNRQALRLYFHGPKGIGKRHCAEALASELGMPLLICDLDKILVAATSMENLSTLLLREAWFQDAILYLDHVDSVSDDNSTISYQTLLDALAGDGGITIMAGLKPWQPSVRNPIDMISVPFQTPDFAERQYLWTVNLDVEGITLDADGLDNLADRFRLTPQQILNAVSTAKSYTRWRTATEPNPMPSFLEGEGQSEGESEKTLSSQATKLPPILNINDLYRAARTQSGHDLAALTQKIEPSYTWHDIVLFDDSKAQLQEICQRVAHRHQVLGDWGFDQKLSLGKGVNALFAGPSGTGKTMAAEIIANELQLDLYRIDLSTVVSKYLGDSEKSLARIFRAAEDANAILLFDEADALFGKRSEVRDSHDRYANIEISYLLQKMEQYDGIALLATNLKGNLDEAFTRRLAFTIHFSFPDEASRQQIWSRIWPVDTPLEDDVDFNMLARRFKLSGGNIKNVALAAAYLAVEDDSVVTMAHLLQAVRREYQKMGKALSAEELNGTPGVTQKVARIVG